MKRCPECMRDYYDDSLLYCLDDGAALLDGPRDTHEEPRTLTLHETADSGDAQTSAKLRTTSLPHADTRTTMSASHKTTTRVAVAALASVIIAAGGFFAFRYFTASTQISSIAIMPFENVGGNADVEYLSDGMTETLISSLSQVTGLDVKPRSSVFRYKGKEADPQAIGRELNVQAVLNGRVTHRGQDLSVYVELIDVRHDKTIWSDTYNRKESELVNLQTDLARDVSRKLENKLSGADEAKVTKTYTTNPEAYQLYLKGNYYRTKYTEEGYKKGIEYYQKAIEIDPGYALAYNGIARAYNTASEWYLPPTEAEPKAKAYAQRAVDLDGSLTNPRYTLLTVAVWYDWDWQEVEREIKSLTAIDRSGFTGFSFYYTAMGRMDDAIKSAESEQRKEPLDLQVNANLAAVYFYAERFDEATRQVKATLELDPNFWSGLEFEGLLFAHHRQFPDAIAALEKARSADTNPELLGYLGYVYAIAGEKAKATKILDELAQLESQRFVSPYYFALVYSGLGDKERTFEWLNKAYDTRSGSMVLINVDPAFENLRSDPRFKELLKRINLPDWR